MAVLFNLFLTQSHNIFFADNFYVTFLWVAYKMKQPPTPLWILYVYHNSKLVQINPLKYAKTNYHLFLYNFPFRDLSFFISFSFFGKLLNRFFCCHDRIFQLPRLIEINNFSSICLYFIRGFTTTFTISGFMSFFLKQFNPFLLLASKAFRKCYVHGNYPDTYDY